MKISSLRRPFISTRACFGVIYALSHVASTTTPNPSSVTSFLSHGELLVASRTFDFAHATVLGLPRKEVQQRRQRLAHKTEAYPENAISQKLTVDTLHSL